MLIYLGVPVTSVNQDNNTVLSEEKLKSILQDSIDNLITDWAYYDYDDDGTKEAFAVFGDTTSNGDQLIYAVFFIDHTGEITPVRDEFWGGNYTYSDSAENTIDHKRYFAVSTDNGTVHSQSYLFGVVNGKPKEFLSNKWCLLNNSILTLIRRNHIVL